MFKRFVKLLHSAKQTHFTLPKPSNFSHVFMTNSKTVKQKSGKKNPPRICEGADVRLNQGHFHFVKVTVALCKLNILN